MALLITFFAAMSGNALDSSCAATKDATEGLCVMFGRGLAHVIEIEAE